MDANGESREEEGREEEEEGKHMWTEFCSEFGWSNIWSMAKTKSSAGGQMLGKTFSLASSLPF